MIASLLCHSAYCALSLLRLLPPSSPSPATPVLLSHLLPYPQTLPCPFPFPPQRLPCPSPLLHLSLTPVRSWWSWSETTTQPTPDGRVGHQGVTANQTSSIVCWSARLSTLCPSSCQLRPTECWAASLSSSRCCEFTQKSITATQY